MPFLTPIALASEGFRYAKRTQNGRYIGMPGKRGATHKVVAKYPRPRVLKDAPSGTIRCIYADPKNYIEFTGENRQTLADAWIQSRTEMARTAIPYSAVTLPLSQIRAKLRARWAKEDEQQNQPENIMAKKTAPKPPKTQKDKAPKDTKNGITRPREGSLTRKVWDLADKLESRAEVLAAADKAGINEATAMTQYGKWRKYNGMEGRSPKVAKKAGKKTPPKAPKKKAPKAPKSEPESAEPEAPEGEVSE